MLHRGTNLVTTSSAGRLFDAVAALVGLRTRTRFEGQAAMELEFAVEAGVEEAYPFQLTDPINTARVVDWEPMLRGILDDLQTGTSTGRVAARFHNTLAEMIAAVARKIGRERVVLSGGCFQNQYLTERTVQRLRAVGFRPYWHQRVPPNDGGLALGQIAAALRSLATEVSDVPGSPR
jgi:hydrogenase maturation protein HypF